jgi:hypothetical protein
MIDGESLQHRWLTTRLYISLADGQSSSKYLEKPGRPHAATDAHRDDDMAHAAALALDQRGPTMRAPDMP